MRRIFFWFSAQLCFTRHMRLSQYEKRCWFGHILFCWRISSFFVFGYSFSFPFWSSFYFCIMILVSLFCLFCISLEWQVGFLVGWRFSMFFLCRSSSFNFEAISSLDISSPDSTFVRGVQWWHPRYQDSCEKQRLIYIYSLCSANFEQHFMVRRLKENKLRKSPESQNFKIL